MDALMHFGASSQYIDALTRLVVTSLYMDALMRSGASSQYIDALTRLLVTSLYIDALLSQQFETPTLSPRKISDMDTFLCIYLYVVILRNRNKRTYSIKKSVWKRSFKACCAASNRRHTS
jgi:hypothetical protein